MTWIKCTDRMPPDEDFVLVYTAAGHYAQDYVDKDTGDFMHCPCLWPDGKIPVQQLEYGSYATHWRPLPEPPKDNP